MNSGRPLRPRERFIESAAIVAGPSVWLLSRIPRSPNVVEVVNNAPVWLDRGDVSATVAAIYRVCRTFEAELASI